MSQVVNPRPFLNTSNVPIVVLVDVQPGCLARPRLFDRFYRNHRVTYRCDSSASQPLDDMPAHEPIPPFAGFPVYGEKI